MMMLLSQSRKALLLVTINYLVTPIVSYNPLPGGPVEPPIGGPVRPPVTPGNTVAPHGTAWDAFSVSFNQRQHPLVQYHAGQNLKFDRVYINVKNSYNAQSGYFRANVPGYYLCGLTTYSTETLHMLKISRQGMQAPCAAHVDTPSHQLSSASCTALVQLEIGDQLSVRSPRDGHLLTSSRLPGHPYTMPYVTFHCHIVQATPH